MNGNSSETITCWSNLGLLFTTPSEIRWQRSNEAAFSSIKNVAQSIKCFSCLKNMFKSGPHANQQWWRSLWAQKESRAGMRAESTQFTFHKLENGNVLLKRPDGGVKVEDYSSVTEAFTPAFSTNQLSYKMTPSLWDALTPKTLDR